MSWLLCTTLHTLANSCLPAAWLCIDIVLTLRVHLGSPQLWAKFLTRPLSPDSCCWSAAAITWASLSLLILDHCCAGRMILKTSTRQALWPAAASILLSGISLVAKICLLADGC